MDQPPFFSIILATRDRVALFADALNSVADQSWTDTEIIVVNDGSGAGALAGYAEVLMAAQARLGTRLRSFQLVHRPRGHGQSYSLNYGVDQARGRYVCFLDDDDVWTDSGHLQRAAQVLQAIEASSGHAADVYMANQDAWKNGLRLPGPTWIEAMAPQLTARGVQPDTHGAYAVGIADLLASGGFCHLNALTIRRALWLQIGGMDEGIRWECDREVFLRLLDAGTRFVHHPATVSKHHVPDPKAGASMTTSLNQIERRLWQLRVLDKSALGLKHPLLRAHARLHKAYALKRIAEELSKQQAWRSARFYAAEALAVRPSLKWTLFTAYCALRELARRGTA